MGECYCVMPPAGTGSFTSPAPPSPTLSLLLPPLPCSLFTPFSSAPWRSFHYYYSVFTTRTFSSLLFRRLPGQNTDFQHDSFISPSHVLSSSAAFSLPLPLLPLHCTCPLRSRYVYSCFSPIHDRRNINRVSPSLAPASSLPFTSLWRS